MLYIYIYIHICTHTHVYMYMLLCCEPHVVAASEGPKSGVSDVEMCDGLRKIVLMSMLKRTSVYVSCQC